MIVGVDFDNTIVNYSLLLENIAIEKGFVSERLGRSKKEIRNKIRECPDGEVEWQKIQAFLYGPRMLDAEIFVGVMEFFRQCKKKGIHVFVISHKTKFAGFDSTQTNLREAAIRWLTVNNFFSPLGADLEIKSVFFLPTRKEKIEMIKNLKCSHFIDDLEETFQENDFPCQVTKILFSPGDTKSSVKAGNIYLCPNWDEIGNLIFSFEGKG